MGTEEKIPATIDLYIAEFPEAVRERMARIRRIIRETVPGVQEKISWRMPTFYVGKDRMHFAGHRNHIGIYPGVRPIELLSKELSGYHTSKGGIQIPHGIALSEDLIRKVAKAALLPEGKN